MQLGAHVVLPLHHPVARQRTSCGHELRGLGLVGDVLRDDRAFGEAGAVRQLQHGHLAFGVDGIKIAPICRAVALGIDLLQVEREATFAQQDVGRQGAGGGRKVQLHGIASGAWWNDEAMVLRM
ncbi:hypothetical protein D3C72_2029380 [compost metagenome]